MEFTNSFTVEAPLATVWTVITNPEEVTPCVPGAQITEIVDDTHFKGTVKVKLGAVQMSYRGTMEMQPDEASHAIVLQGKGTEARGSGGASGKVTVRLQEQGTGTEVNILAQVDVTGRVAQFGRGIMQDVSNRLIRDFASCLESKLTSGGDTEESSVDTTASALAAPSGPSPEPSTAQSSSSNPSSPPAESSTQSAPPVPPPPAQSPAASASTSMTRTAPEGGGNNELRIAEILLDITRSRIAAGLRALATRIEPK